MPAAGQHYAYFHGLPGTPDEFGDFAPESLRTQTIRIDRLSAPGQTYEQSLLSAFDNATRDVNGQLVLIGFSLGAMAALRVAARRPDLTARICLASPAAPLELGEFLPTMAGRLVFEAARRGAWALGALSTGQSAFLALNWPGLRRQMLQGVSTAERSLMETPEASGALRSGLRHCLGPRRQAYHRELQAFVKPWSDVISQVTQPVEIWQGASDTWTPPAMAQALHARLGPRATLKTCEGLGHYSTLAAMLRSL